MKKRVSILTSLLLQCVVLASFMAVSLYCAKTDEDYRILFLGNILIALFLRFFVPPQEESNSEMDIINIIDSVQEGQEITITIKGVKGSNVEINKVIK
ncbi:MAG: hypothetical protein PHX51_08650 [Clostridia bacterium]|nr:hypothetical protein [Clostridia bacterium]